MFEAIDSHDHAFIRPTLCGLGALLSASSVVLLSPLPLNLIVLAACHRQVKGFDPNLPWLLTDKLLPGTLTFSSGTEGRRKQHVLACSCPSPLLLDLDDHNITIDCPGKKTLFPKGPGNKISGCSPCHRDAVCALAIKDSNRTMEECLTTRAPAPHGGMQQFGHVLSMNPRVATLTVYAMFCHFHFILKIESLLLESGSGIILSRGLVESVNFTKYESCVHNVTLKYGPARGGDAILAECL